MNLRKMSWSLTGATLLALSAIALIAFTPAGAQDQQRDQEPTRAERAEFAQQFWDYLKKVNYQEEWPMWPDKEGFYPGTSPHGAFLKLYVNQKVLGNVDDLPEKSIIIKENYGENKEKLMAITIMYKVKDYDPEHGDWWYVKYGPDGKVMRQDDMLLAGKVKGCINCHQGAEGDDYVFTNDGE